MKKILPDYIFKAVFMLFLLLAPAAALAAQKPIVLVLPFQANAGPEMPDASISIPQQIIDHLDTNGLAAVPVARAGALMRQTKTETIDLETARRLGRQAGANLVIYGAFNQLGDGFSMETRLVPVAKGEAVPAAFERSSLLALSECAETISKRAADMAGDRKSVV